MNALRSRRCETCAWWQRGGAALSAADRDPLCEMSPDLGACQVGAPVMTEMGKWGALCGAWPQTRAHRFCGEWEPVIEGGGPDDGERAPTVVPIRGAAA